MTSKPVSPCVSICALDGDDVCVGCFRTGGEISYWGLLDAQRQHEVLNRCERRMAGEPAPCVVQQARKEGW
nr:DUF1289 domain-containing protein [Alloalcanivorax mobilis]